MRFVTYVSGGPARAGVVVGDNVHGAEPGVSLVDLLGDLEGEGQRLTRDPVEVVPLGLAELRMPIGTPPSIRDFSAYEAHMRTMGRGRPFNEDWYELPIFYFSNPAAARGPSDDIEVSPGCVDFDYELELACVVGREGTNLTVEEAGSHIAGYVVMCDWSARDVQRREMAMNFGPVKGKDSRTSFGGLLVTPDELEHHRSGNGFDLAATASVNGRTYTDANVKDVYWSFPEMLAYASRGTTLVPGDVIASGTVGTGCIAELSGTHGADAYPFLKPGDRVHIEIDHVGAIEAAILPSLPLHPLRPGRGG